MEDGGEESPRLKGVVIITLPPSDNPSLGKTITAFTVVNDSGEESRSHHHQESPEIRSPESRNPPLLQAQSRGEGQFSFQRFSGSPIRVFAIISMFMMGLYFWNSSTQENFFELPESDGDRNSNTIILPLFSKIGVRGDFELKLKISAETLFNDSVRHQKTAKKIISAQTDIDSTTIFPISGNVFPDGLYFTYVLVGTPPRPYYLDVDTGSDLTWIQCDAPCASCAKGAHPFYKPSTSKIIHSDESYCAEIQKSQKTNCASCNQCDYEIEYTDQSSSLGVLVRDKFHLSSSNGSIINSNLVFGCAYDQQGLLLNSLVKTDGILGLSKGEISLPSQLTAQGSIKNVIAHCLAAEAGRGGYMFLGNDFVPHKQMTWVSMLKRPSLNSYHAEVTKLNFGGKGLSLSAKSNRLIVFDSGSSYTYIPSEAYSDLLAKLEDSFGETFVQDTSDTTLDVCWQTKFEIRSLADIGHYFKPLDIHFGSKLWIMPTKLKIPPEGYLVISKKGNVCLGIMDGGKVHDDSTIILGDISLRGQLFVYDNVKEKIGWMKSDCTRPRIYEKLPFS